jgi:hypothetical protein
MTNLEKLTEAFRIANANFDREDSAALKLRGQLDRLPLNATADEYARLHAELELQKRRVAESSRLMQEAGSRLDVAQGAEAHRAQREADQRNLDAKRKELNDATAALSMKQDTCLRLQREIAVDAPRVQVLMAEYARLQQSGQRASTQPRWYDDVNRLAVN